MKTGWAAAVAAGIVFAGGAFAYVRFHSVEPLVQAAAKRKAAPTSPVAAAKIVVENRERDLGIIDSVERLTQIFWVRNEGTAPLKLDRGPTSCKCTMSDLPAKPIPPGVRAEVRVASKVSDKRGPFSLSATVLTNDPATPSVTFKVQGSIRSRVALDPPRIVFSGIKPGESFSAHATVYSELWNEFRISAVKSSLRGLTWRITPATREKISTLGARCAYDVAVTLPADLVHHNCTESLDMILTAVDNPSAEKAEKAKKGGSAESLKLEIVAQTIESVVISGDKLLFGEYVQFGKLRRGEGAREVLVMKINDEHRRLAVRKIVTDPAFLHVKVEPFSSASAKVGLYRIELEIPQDAPVCAYLVGRHAKIKIETDHPRAKSIELEAEFAVY